MEFSKPLQGNHTLNYQNVPPHPGPSPIKKNTDQLPVFAVIKPDSSDRLSQPPISINMMTKALILLVVVAICCDVTVDGEILTTTVSSTVIMQSVLQSGKYDSVFTVFLCTNYILF